MGAEKNDDGEHADWNARKKIKGFTQEEDTALGDAIQAVYDRDARAQEKRRKLESDR